ncbi:MAG: hypothetical protein HOM11_06555 [Methylococcales bacterium]|jgi:hypothetical protein|nr:hypothetical protein [Methylococcales bacterium]MBT7442713.1 hypothetical protein [Methylococcales bacterium]
MTKYRVSGKSLTLSQREFVAQGGEGAIYGRGEFAYKIYHQGQAVLSLDKLSELQNIQNDNVIKPLSLVEHNAQAVGYQMRWVKETFPLVKLFSNAGRTQLGATPESTLLLLTELQTLVQAVHDANYLMVDGNEMNYLVSKSDLTTAFCIDVDSYQTENSPAVAIMPSIRDWSTTVFSMSSDWFSFAIIACQLLLGIHPFKGRHPNVKKKDIQLRQQLNLSIFNAETTLPPTVRSFDVIPQNWLQWFIDLFEHGLRRPPPDVVGTGHYSPSFQLIQSLDAFAIKNEVTVEDVIGDYVYCQGQHVYSCGDTIVQGGKPFSKVAHYVGLWCPGQLEVVFQVAVFDGKLCVASLQGHSLWHELVCDQWSVSNGILLVKNAGLVYEVECLQLSGQTYFKAKNQWPIMPQASQLFQGVLLQNMLGRGILSLFLGGGRCVTMPIPELDGAEVVDAVVRQHIGVFVVFRSKQYVRLTITWSDDYSEYRCTESLTEYYDVNLVVLESGVGVSIVGDGELILLSDDFAQTAVKMVQDPHIRTDMRLWTAKNKALFSVDNGLYSWRMR